MFIPAAHIGNAQTGSRFTSSDEARAYRTARSLVNDANRLVSDSITLDNYKGFDQNSTSGTIVAADVNMLKARQQAAGQPAKPPASLVEKAESDVQNLQASFDPQTRALNSFSFSGSGLSCDIKESHGLLGLQKDRLTYSFDGGGTTIAVFQDGSINYDHVDATEFEEY